MRSPIRANIEDGIAEGLSVDRAYDRMAKRMAKRLVEGVRQGGTVEEALVALGVPNLREVALRLDQIGAHDSISMKIVLTGGHIDTVPSAECVAERLRSRSNPTRKDIEEAFAYCSKK
jgi:hypothetical protein